MRKTHLSVELVHDEMTEGGFEEVLLGTVFQQWVVHRVGSNLETNSLQLYKRKNCKKNPSKCVLKIQQYLLVDLDGLLVLLQLSAVSPHFQQTLIGRTEENTTETYELFPHLCVSTSHK